MSTGAFAGLQRTGMSLVIQQLYTGSTITLSADGNTLGRSERSNLRTPFEPAQCQSELPSISHPNPKLFSSPLFVFFVTAASVCKIMDWAHLPLKLLETISQKLYNIFDYCHFRAVCKSWLSAAPPANLPPQMPWLALPFGPFNSRKSLFPDCDARPFAKPSKVRITLDMPDARRKLIYGSSYSWVLTLDWDLSVSLLNPLTRAQIPLPSFATGLPAGEVIKFLNIMLKDLNYEEEGEDDPFFTNMHDFILATYLSADPTSGADCAVVIAFDCLQQFIFCRPGDARWTGVDAALPEQLDNIWYHDGNLYPIDYFGNTAIIGTGAACSSSNRLYIPFLVDSDGDPYPNADSHSLVDSDGDDDPNVDRHYLVELSGEVLLVRRIGCGNCESFDIYKLVQGERWMRVWSIGDMVLVLDAVHASIFPASKSPDCHGDCIYYTGFSDDHGLYKYCIKDGNIDRIPMYDDMSMRWKEVTWFVPSLC